MGSQYNRLMREIMAAILGVLWIGCGGDGGGGDDAAPVPDACEGLRCKITDCVKSDRPPTRVSGTVLAPNGTLPLHGASVYVPNTDPGPLPDGAQCTSRCPATAPPGDPIAFTVSEADGKFTLYDVPSGGDIPLVITAGKWRRQITIPEVTECGETVLPASLTALPARKAEGDLPRIAIVTGRDDALECVARKLGIADAELTPDGGDGRVHLFASNGADRTAVGATFAPASTLWSSADKLSRYDLVLMSCEGSQLAADKSQAAMAALKQYADRGGRVFLSHLQNVWISGEDGDPQHAPPVWPAIASCRADASPPGTGTGVIDRATNPYGAVLASWLVHAGGSSTLGELPLTETFQSCTSLDRSRAERWLYPQSGGADDVHGFQIPTPAEAHYGAHCGKVVHFDLHVASGSTSSPAMPFPTGCDAGPLTPQELAFAYTLFLDEACLEI